MVQRGFNFAIVDEVDSILIDEARTPLIISGPSEDSSELYRTVDAYIPRLGRGGLREGREAAHGLADRERHREDAGLARRGGPAQAPRAVRHRQRHAGPPRQPGAARAPLFTRDVDYLVKNGKVVIVDEFTGRMMEGRRYSDGLHQALEAKEKVPIQPENQTLASITFQNYFRLYPKLAGMTGTAATEASEFARDLRPRGGRDPDPHADDPRGRGRRGLSHRGREVQGDRREHRRGPRARPAGPGRHGQHREVGASVGAAQEGEDPAPRAERALPRAGGVHRRPGRAASAASRSRPTWPAAAPTSSSAAMPTCASCRSWPGSRTRPSGAARRPQIEQEVAAEKEKVIAAGGLYVLGTERHELRRIDNQLRGRSGRQGDPGSLQVLPVARGRPDADLRLRAHGQHARQARPARRTRRSSIRGSTRRSRRRSRRSRRATSRSARIC